MAFFSCRQCPQMDLQRQNQRSRCWWVWNGYGFPSRLHSFKYPLQRRIRINSQIHLRKGGRPHAARRGVIFFASFYLPSFIEWQRCKGATDRRSDHSISVARFMPQKDTQMEARGFLVKVARNRKATISFSLRQRCHSLIRKCQDFLQRPTDQESFRSLRN